MIKIKHGFDAKQPLDRLEHRLAAGQVNLKPEIADEYLGAAVAKVIKTPGAGRTVATRHRELAIFHHKFTRSGQIEKQILSTDGQISFEDALPVIVPAFGLGFEVGRFVGIAGGVAPPRNEPGMPPTIRDGDGVRAVALALGGERFMKSFSRRSQSLAAWEEKLACPRDRPMVTASPTGVSSVYFTFASVTPSQLATSTCVATIR